MVYSKHLSVSHAAAMHTALSVDCIIATRGALPGALLAHIFQHAPPEQAPPLVAWRLKVSVPKLGVALDLRDGGGSRGTRDVLQVAVRNAVVVLQDMSEVRSSRTQFSWVLSCSFHCNELGGHTAVIWHCVKCRVHFGIPIYSY